VEGGPEYSCFLFFIFLNHKVIEKSLFYEAEIGLIEKITS
jgi:hypothetical protein